MTSFTTPQEAYDWAKAHAKDFAIVVWPRIGVFSVHSVVRSVFFPQVVLHIGATPQFGRDVR